MVAYVRIVEEIIINVLVSMGIKGERVEYRSGVWILGDGITQDKKIAALGMRVSRNTTMHGFAINCCNDTAPFQQFIPCGISDAGVTTISEQLPHRHPRRYFGAAGGRASEVPGPPGRVFRAHCGAGLNAGLDAVKKHRTGRTRNASGFVRHIRKPVSPTPERA